MDLRNDGDETVEDTSFSFDDVHGELAGVEGAALAPGDWSSLRFGAGRLLLRNSSKRGLGQPDGADG